MLLAEFATRYKNIVPNLLHKTLSKNFSLPRSVIVQFNSLHTVHTLLLSHTYKLCLNDSRLYTLHLIESSCDISHILIECSALHTKYDILLNFLKSLNIFLTTIPSLIPNSSLII